jgi:hypothetical protein
VNTANAGQPGGPPVIAVTRGRPTHAETAAVVAVLLSARAAATPEPAAPSARPSRWAEGRRTRAALPRPGPHSWRGSALPR